MPYVCFSKIATDDLINKARELNNKYEDIEQKWFSFHILSFFLILLSSTTKWRLRDKKNIYLIFISTWAPFVDVD